MPDYWWVQKGGLLYIMYTFTIKHTIPMVLTGNDVEGISANMFLVVIIETHFAAQIEVPISVAAKW